MENRKRKTEYKNLSRLPSPVCRINWTDELCNSTTCLGNYLWQHIYYEYIDKIVNTKNIFYEKYFVCNSNYFGGRLAIGRFCLQCKWFDPCTHSSCCCSSFTWFDQKSLTRETFKKLTTRNRFIASIHQEINDR